MASYWDRLRSFARVIAFDKRGQGLSDRGPYTVEDVAADAVAVLDAAGVERASVLGVSEGGTACDDAGRHLPGAGVGDGPVRDLRAASRAAEDFPQGLPVERARADLGEADRRLGEAPRASRCSPPAPDDPELQDFWARMLRSGVSPSTMRTLGEMYISLDVRPLLPGITAPTLVLWRDGDRLIPPALDRGGGRRDPRAPGAWSSRAHDHLFFAGEPGGCSTRSRSS